MWRRTILIIIAIGQTHQANVGEECSKLTHLASALIHSGAGGTKNGSVLNSLFAIL